MPLAIYVIEFAVVDTMLSLGFLAFAVKGPNDMHLVDATLWRWNWSPPAKAVNTASIVLLCLLGHPALASLAHWPCWPSSSGHAAGCAPRCPRLEAGP